MSSSEEVPPIPPDKEVNDLTVPPAVTTLEEEKADTKEPAKEESLKEEPPKEETVKEEPPKEETVKEETKTDEPPKETPKEAPPTKIKVKNGFEFIEVLCGRINEKNIDTEDFKNSLQTNEFLSYTNEDGTQAKLTPGSAWPRIDNIHWELKTNSDSTTAGKKKFGFMDRRKAARNEGDVENPDTKYPDPLDTCKFIQKEAEKKLGPDTTDRFKEDLEKTFQSLGLDPKSSPFFIDDALFKKSMTGQNGLCDIKSGPMMVDTEEKSASESDSDNEGVTTKQSADDRTSHTKHEILDAYLLMNNIKEAGTDALDDQFKQCIGEMRKQGETMYDTIPEEKRTNPDVQKLRDSLDTLHVIETGGQWTKDGNKTGDDAITAYYTAMNDFLNSNGKSYVSGGFGEFKNNPPLDFFMDLFIFAWRKYKEYENEWIKTATACFGKAATKDTFTQLGGAPGGEPRKENNGVINHYSDDDGLPEGVEGDEGLNIRRIPARPNPFVVVPAIIAMVYFSLQLFNTVNRVYNSFAAFHGRVEFYQNEQDTDALFAGPDEETCYATLSFSVLWEYIRNYFWSGFDMTMSELSARATSRLEFAARATTAAAQAAASDTWTFGSLSFFANAASGTTTQYATTLGRNQLNYEVAQSMAASLLQFNNWAASFDYTIRATTTTLVLGMNGFFMSSLVLLNQINPYAINSYTVRAAIAAFSAQWATPAGVVPLLAYSQLAAQFGLITRGVRNYMLGRVDLFGYDPTVQEEDVPDVPIVPRPTEVVNAIRHYTGFGDEDSYQPINESGMQITNGEDRNESADPQAEEYRNGFNPLDALFAAVAQATPAPVPTASTGVSDLLNAADEGKSDGEESD